MDNWKTYNQINASKKIQHAFKYLWQNEFYVIRQLILKAFLVISMGPTQLAIAFRASAIPDLASRFQLFMIFFIVFIIYIFIFKNYYESLIYTIEKYIALIRINVMDKVRQAELVSFEKIGSEKIYSALTFDIMTVSEISHSLAMALISIVLLIDLMLYLAYLSGQAFLFSMCAIFIASYFYIDNQQKLRKAALAVREYENKMFKLIHGLLYGYKELRLNDKKNNDFYANGLKLNMTRLQDLKLFSGQKFTNNFSIANGLHMILIVGIVLLLPITGLTSHETLFTIVALVLFLPIGFLIDQAPRLTLATISLQRLFDLENELLQLNKESKTQVTISNTFTFHELKYTDITYRYTNINDDGFKTGPISFSIKAGEILFITGGNGSGKSTLLKLITGLYPIHSGRVDLNHKEIDIGCYRSLFSAIFFDYHLFDRFYGAKTINHQKVNELIKMMQLDKKVKFENNRFNTLHLSTGQRKRLALIMSIIDDKPVAIFDEWAANQDPEFRNKFYECILPQLKKQGKAIIVVSHDENYFHHSDKLIRLDFGKVKNVC
jgi:putative ATP-binding cassette transporter